MKNLFSVQGEHTMIKTDVLILSVFAVFFMAVAAGAALLALPAILGRSGGAPGTGPLLPGGANPGETPVFEPSATTTPVEPTVTLPPTQAPTETALPSATPTATAIPLPCDWAAFVDDVSVEDGTLMVPGEPFVKTWRLRNIGSCSWTADYDLAFVSGQAMEAPISVSLGGIISPGETVDVSVPMQAPEDDGSYTGYWMLRNPSGGRFGIGEAQSRSIWVSIAVAMPCYRPGFDVDVTVPDGRVIWAGMPWDPYQGHKKNSDVDNGELFEPWFLGGGSRGRSETSLQFTYQF